MVTRYGDWASRLMAWVREHEHRPFAWGRWDCALAAADAVRVLTGDDLAAEFRGRYEDAEGALACLNAAGYTGLDDVATAKLGLPLTSVLRTQRGDLVLGETKFGPALLICIGSTAIGPGEHGWQQVRMAAWHRSWRVG